MSEEPRSLDDVLDGDRMVMLVSPDMTARPMTLAERDGRHLWFLTSRDASWVANLDDGARMSVVLIDPSDSNYVALIATATRTADRQTLERLWAAPMEAWFDGVDDPRLVALRLEVVDGEYWDGPDTGVGRVLRGLAAVATGEGRDKMGDKGDVEV